MLFKKGLLIVLTGAGIGVAATLASSQVTTADLVSPTKDGSFQVFSKQTEPMSASGCPGMGMQMMDSMLANNEFDYLRKMIPHHQEAIATAKLLKAGTNRPEMKKFADDIIRIQSAEIQKMQNWLNQWYPNQKAKVAYTPMMRDLTNLKGDALDRAFLEDMRMHHMGAIMMSQHLLMDNLAKHNEVKTLAQQIITAQRKEIHQMQAWLRSWFNVAGMMGNRGNYRFGMGGMHNMNRFPK